MQANQRSTTFLGRPAVILTLGPGTSEGGERSHKRSRPSDTDGAGGGDEVPGGVQQVARAMLRAHKLGVLVPLLYSADPTAGVAVVEAVLGRRLRELLAEAAMEAAGVQTAGVEAAGGRAAGAEEAGAARATKGEKLAAQAQSAIATSAADAEEPSGSAAATASAGNAGKTAPEAVAAERRTNGLPPGLASVASSLGRSIALLHDGGQVHGGLSGQSVLLREGDGAVVLTDFWRSYNTIIPLDKAADLAGLQVALEEEAKEAGKAEADKAEAVGRAAAELSAQLFEQVLTSYRAASRYWSATHNKLPEARAKARSQPPSKRPKLEPASAAPNTAPADAPAAEQ